MTTTSELTPFYPPHIKPLRRGVYLVKDGWHVYSNWDGNAWGETFFNIDDAAASRFSCPRQNFPWCGLAKNPGEANA